MSRRKSYNRLPNPIAEFSVGAAALGCAGLALSPLARELISGLLAAYPATSVWAPPSVAAVAAAALVVAIATSAALALVGWARFHDGSWMGERPSSNRSSGSARIESRPSRLRREFDAWRRGKPACPGLVVGGVGGSGRELLVADVTHALVIGDTGSGKTTSCILPTIVSNLIAGSSLVVLDPKGECYDLTASFAEKAGYDVYCVDFSSPGTSDGWLPLSPLLDCAQEKAGRSQAELAAEARALAATLVPDQGGSGAFWAQSARTLLAGICSYVASSESVPDEARNLSSVAAVAAMGQEELAGIVARLPIGSAARVALESLSNAPEETFGGFRANLDAALNVYSDPYVSGMLARSEFGADDFADRRTALFVKFDSSSRAYDPLVITLVSQLIAGLRRTAERRYGGRLPRPVYLLLEEFPQLPRMDGLSKHLAVIRSLGMHAMLVAQSRSQIEATYREDADAILNNLGTTLFLGANDVRTCEYYSRLLGCYTVETRSRSSSRGSHGGSSGNSVSYRESPLIRPEELEKWDWRAGHLVIRGGQAFACSSLPVSRTAAGIALGLGGKEPDAATRERLRPSRQVKNPDPAPVWRPGLGPGGGDAEEIASAIEASADPRFMD